MKNFIITNFFWFLLFFVNPCNLFSGNSIKFFTTAQQFGVADLDYFELTSDTLVPGSIYEAEYPSNFTTGFFIYRGNASNVAVWGQLGGSTGEVSYHNVPGNGTYYMRIKYSRDHFLQAPPVEVYINGELQSSWIPEITGDWNSFQTTAWIPIEFTSSPTPAYYHPFQNFDDDVDRIKKFSNFFTGNAGIIGNTSLITLDHNPNVTRTGFGRSLEISYDNLEGYALYVESFKWSWFDNSSSLNMNDLFPNFVGSGFENRGIDSIVFYCRLEASVPLAMQLELSDINNNKGVFRIDLTQFNDWVRVAVAICDFERPEGGPPFNASKAKFLGFTFADSINGESVNLHESGTIYLDDIYLVENGFEKPSFQNDDDLLDYLNKVRFRFFWEAIDPSSKFIFDRHLWNDLVSVDGIGWQLSTYTIAHRNGWVEPQLIEARTEEILYNLLYECEHTDNLDSAYAYPLRYASVKGNWAHFLNSGNLLRKNVSTEYSLFTNALLLSGIIVARQYFDDNSNIVTMADSIIAMTDWNFLYDSTENLMHFHWTPEDGVSPYKTDWFSEELDLVFLLGISSPNPLHRLPDNPYFSNGYRRPKHENPDYIFSAPGTGFTYWFLQMYAKFADNTQRFRNTRNAILNDIALDQNTLGNFNFIYDDRVYGISACEGPDSSGFIIIGTDTFTISNYHAYGYCNKLDTNNDPNGTIPPYGGISTVLFTPEEALELVKYYYYDLDSIFTNEFQYSFWSPIFDFPDAFHLDPDNSFDTLINELGFNGPWLSVPRFAIDAGPMLINTDSYLAEKGYYSESSIRELFSLYEPIVEELLEFDTIQALDMVETIEIGPDSCIIIIEGEEVVFTALVFDDEIFSYEYEWMLNGEVIKRTEIPTINCDSFEISEGDTLSCRLLIPLENCNSSISTISNAIEICKIIDNIDNIDNIKPLMTFDVFPNPSKGNLNVKIELTTKKNAILRLTNLVGQLLLEKEIEGKSYCEFLDLANYPNGIYMLSLIIDDQTNSKKIVKSS